MSGIRKREQKNHSCKFTAVVLFISEEKRQMLHRKQYRVAVRVTIMVLALT